MIPYGLALCKLHHAAFDTNMIGVTPDLEVTVRLDGLKEIDGPCSNTACRAPAILAERYALFRRAS